MSNEVKPIKGSTWVKLDAKGEAKCPHCGGIAYHRGDRWCGCGSARPGSDDGKPAMVFTGDAQCRSV